MHDTKEGERERNLYGGSGTAVQRIGNNSGDFGSRISIVRQIGAKFCSHTIVLFIFLPINPALYLNLQTH